MMKKGTHQNKITAIHPFDVRFNVFDEFAQGRKGVGLFTVGNMPMIPADVT